MYEKWLVMILNEYPQIDDAFKQTTKTSRDRYADLILNDLEREMINKYLNIFLDYYQAHKDLTEDHQNELYLVFVKTIKRLLKQQTPEAEYNKYIKRDLCVAHSKMKAEENDYKLDNDANDLNITLTADYSAHIINKVLVRDLIDNTQLTDRERSVTSLFFGFDNEPMIMADIAKHYGVTVERIRQILRRAIRKMRWSINKIGHRKALKGELEN